MLVCPVFRGARGIRSVVAILFVACVAAASPHAAATAPLGCDAADPYAAILAEHAISPDVDGIVAYLRGLTPTPENRTRIRTLIGRLDSLDFAARELAARQLIAMPVVPADDLRAPPRTATTARCVFAPRR